MAEVAGPHLMVVDDDELVRALVRDVFEADGWTVTEAPGGARALALLREPPFPDVVLLDLVMPGVDGFAVLTELRAANRSDELLIVALSARDGHLARRMAVGLGADDCVTKPFDPEALRSQCAELVEKASWRRVVANRADALAR